MPLPSVRRHLPDYTCRSEADSKKLHKPCHQNSNAPTIILRFLKSPKHFQQMQGLLLEASLQMRATPSQEVPRTCAQSPAQCSTGNIHLRTFLSNLQNIYKLFCKVKARACNTRPTM